MMRSSMSLMSVSLVLSGKPGQLIDLLARSAAGHHLLSPGHSALQRIGEPGDVDRRTCIEGDDVTRRTGSIIQRSEEHVFGSGALPNLKLLQFTLREAELARMNSVFAHFPVLELGDHGLAADRDLIEPLHPVHHHDVLAA